MQIFALIAVVIVSFVTVMMGLDEVPPPPPSVVAPPAVSTGAGQPEPPPEDVNPAVPQAAPAPLPFPAPLTDGGGTAPIVMPDFPRATNAPAAKCNIEACRAAYRSFTDTDCTYQPLEGPRRLCTK
jgi:hypothetical protein